MLSFNPAISENIQELRMIIECEAIRLAVKRATPEEMANLRTSGLKLGGQHENIQELIDRQLTPTPRGGWFDEYNYEVMVDRSYLSEELLRALDAAPMVLKPWDPMGALAL